MRFIQRSSRAGLSLVELICLLAVVGLLGMIFMTHIADQRRPATRIRCINNLKNSGLAFRIFATDNNDLFPPALMLSNGVDVTKIDSISVFRTLSNELSTPKILYCPTDVKRKIAEGNFDTISTKNISYFASLSANETNPAALLAGDRNLMTNGKAVGPGVFGLTTNVTLGWTKEMHGGQGNTAMADGSVQQSGNLRLKKMVAEQELATNWLAIP
jgi:prepilin-type processing-associated H-X9-DG protein